MKNSDHTAANKNPSTLEVAFILTHLFSLYDEHIEDPEEFVSDFLLVYYDELDDLTKQQILSLFL